MGGIRLAVAVSVMMLSSLSSGLRAQLGPMEVLPEWGQAGWSNPAILHPSGSHILIGGVSGFQLEVDHSGPHYADFISADGLVDPMALLERMDPVETVGVRSEVPLISLGFREKERFEFRLRSRVVAEQQFSYDRDLFDIAWRGNGHPDNIGRPISFSEFGLHSQAYLDHGLSVGAMAKEDKLWLGWGIHLLNGLGAFEIDQFDAVWTTDTLDYSWDLQGGMAVHSAGLDLDSLLEGGEVTLPTDSGMPETIGAGVAFDYGFRWKLTPKVELEGSIEGRGGLRWLESVSRKEVDPSSFVLEGIDLVEQFNGADSLQLDSLSLLFEDWQTEMLDSLSDAFSVQTAPGAAAAFDTRIRETWRFGIRFRPHESVEISALAYRQFSFGRVREGGLFGLTYRFRGNVTVHAQAQFHNGDWLWGSGISLRGGPIRFSASARHVPGLLLPLEAGHWQGQAGLSFDIGYVQKQKKRRKNDLGTGKGMWH